MSICRPAAVEGEVDGAREAEDGGVAAAGLDGVVAPAEGAGTGRSDGEHEASAKAKARAEARMNC